MGAPPNHIPPTIEKGKCRFWTGHGRECKHFLKHFATLDFYKSLILKIFQRVLEKILEEKKVKKCENSCLNSCENATVFLSLSIERNINN
jgi:hypothetical protein